MLSPLFPLHQPLKKAETTPFDVKSTNKNDKFSNPPIFDSSLFLSYIKYILFLKKSQVEHNKGVDFPLLIRKEAKTILCSYLLTE
jgi:hypothetical protein